MIQNSIPEAGYYVLGPNKQFSSSDARNNSPFLAARVDTEMGLNVVESVLGMRSKHSALFL